MTGARASDSTVEFVQIAPGGVRRLAPAHPGGISDVFVPARLRAQGRGAPNHTLEELADGLEVDREGFLQTIREFNAACQDRPYDPTLKDGKGTVGITPAKSNWALPMDSPPYVGFAVTCGITFTFGGLRVNTAAQVLDLDNHPIPGLYAAGELVGGLFYHNYPGGSGLVSGAVFGRIAGQQAAQYAEAPERGTSQRSLSGR